MGWGRGPWGVEGGAHLEQASAGVLSPRSGLLVQGLGCLLANWAALHLGLGLFLKHWAVFLRTELLSETLGGTI